MSADWEMSTIECKPENDLCRCCHSEGSFKNLYTPYSWLDVEKIVYAAMLQECFNIELLEVRESLQHVLCSICYTCIQKLEEAVKFKRQIQKCESRFLNIYMGCVKKVTDPCELIVKEAKIKEINIKEEVLDIEENMLFESHASPNRAASDVGRPDDGHNASDYGDDGIIYNDDTNLQPFTQEVIVEKEKRVKKSSIRTKKAKPTAKVKKKNKVIKKKTKPIKEEDVLDTIEGGIKVIRGPLVKRDVDYKEVENGYQCLKCPRVSKNTNSMRDHIRKVHLNIPKYKCPTCFKTFPTIAQFTKHKLDEHDMDHRFKCNACNNAFNTKVQLKKHINNFHMLGLKIKCTECDYETFSVESLYKHKFKHKTVKDYQCKYCRKAFVRKTTLQLHERIHTGDRRKVCTVCGQAFVQKASLNYHMTKYHPEVAF